jgi:acyl-CoA reductase-like NAD-dependent aldehyde dehydrogenase
MKEFRNYIGGKWVDASNGATAIDENPANIREHIAQFPSATREDAARAIDAAQKTFPAWAKTPSPKRGDILYKAANWLESRLDEIGEGLTREEGKTLAESKGEATRAIGILKYYAGECMQPSGDVYPSANAATFLYAERVPIGVVGIITPWNFPIAIPVWKMAPALAYGNSVVFKPAELTPLTAWHIVNAFEQAGLPPGVLNLVAGLGSEAGQEIVGSPAVKAVSFTGSNEVGRRIGAQAVARGGKVQLELGGKNPIVVLNDADISKAVELTVQGAMLSTGQKCTATSRAIVVRDIAARYRDALAACVERLRVGDGMKPDVYMGPLVSAEAEQMVLNYIAIGCEEGARLVTGGKKLRGDEYEHGHFVAPTVFDLVTPDMRIAEEEIFGPVVAIIEARDVDDAIRLANHTRFGLSASVVTRDLNLAMRFIREIEAGLVHVNSMTAGAEPQVPFGGLKDSSSGSREQGKTARDFFTQWKTIYMDPL